MKKYSLIFALILIAGFYHPPAARAQSKFDTRLEEAALVVNAIMRAPDNGIPLDFLNRAVCVGIIPSEKKFAFFVGGNYGRGALVCRRGGNGPWGAPSMISVSGASYGIQFGGEGSDVVFIVMNPETAEKLMQQTLKLGMDASAAAGPVGRRAEGATNAHFNAEILSYSRSKGLFAGLSLSGSVVKEDSNANRKLYGRDLTPEQILIQGVVAPPASAKALDGVLEKYSPHGGKPFPKTSATSK
ncbi:MAG TPA: lipid-binding SYLF domain-containing protein [Terriglobia bacterium]|nr:lipid-binding SYLF domain-containing protein [Terriglobia bacterium]